MAATNAQMRLKTSFELGGALASAGLFCLLMFPFLADGNGDRKRVRGGGRKASAAVCRAGY